MGLLIFGRYEVGLAITILFIIQYPLWLPLKRRFESVSRLASSPLPPRPFPSPDPGED